MVMNQTMDIIYARFNQLLSSFSQHWLSLANLELYAAAVNQKEAALDNCWGFVDGTVRPICRPGTNQCIMYNGHKQVHSIKFQSVVAANGLVANMYGPVEGFCFNLFWNAGFALSWSVMSSHTLPLSRVKGLKLNGSATIIS